MKLEMGLYFRTKEGIIGKIDSISKDGTEIYFDTKPIFSDSDEVGSKWCYATDIIKASHNIIDLIEVGDYVNGYLINEIYDDTDKGRQVYHGAHDMMDEFGFYNDDIKTILTHKQFENNCYILQGEEVK